MINETTASQIGKKVFLWRVFLCGVALAVLFVATASASAQTVTLHNDSGAGDNINTGSYTPDNLTSDTTPTITLAGFTGSIAITASHATASDVTHTLASGNGDYTFTTALAEGRWTITATDSASPTPNTAILIITVLHELVSNMGENTHADTLRAARHRPNSAAGIQKVAQSFTTGSKGFSLKEVHFDIHRFYKNFSNTLQFELELMTSTGNPSRPGSRVTTNSCNIFNTLPASLLSTGEYKYEISANKECFLEANTEYFLVFQIKNTGNTAIDFNATSSDTDSGEAAWSIANSCLNTTVLGSSGYGATGTWSDCANNRSVKVGLFGLGSRADLKASSDTGSSPVDNITNDNTPTIVTSGFTQGTATTISAAKTGSTPVTATIADGNGEVDLGTLVDGVWTITATQGSNNVLLKITIDTVAPGLVHGTWLGHLSNTDRYINKADVDDTSNTIYNGAIITGDGSGTVASVVIESGVSCNHSLSYGSAAVTTNDVLTTDGEYKVCSRAVDVAGNIRYTGSSVFTRDTAVPTISGVTSTSSSVTFTTSEAGVVAANVACGIATDTTVVSGENTIQLTGLTDSTLYDNCTFTVTDAAGNPSATTDIPDFTFSNVVFLVSNAGQVDATTNRFLVDGEPQAQGFTTGATPVKLTTVGFNIKDAATDTSNKLTVDIQGETNGGIPNGVNQVRMSNVLNSTTQEVTTENVAGAKTVDFSSSNIILKPNTTYFVVFTYNGDATDSLALQLTDADGEDVGGVTGADINNSQHHYQSGSWGTQTSAIEIAVNADTGAFAYLSKSSDTGKSDVDNVTYNDTPTVTVSGFSGNVTVTAVRGFGDYVSVTATRSGDGDVTLPSLERDFSWYISATDGTNSSLASAAIWVSDLLTGNVDSRIAGRHTASGLRIVDFAQKFNTTDTGIYTLQHIEYYAVNGATSTNATLTISVQGKDGSGNPDGTALASTIVDSSDIGSSRGIKKAHFAEPLILAKNTDYFIVFAYRNASASDAFALRYLSGNTSTEEDVEGVALNNWSLGDKYHYKSLPSGSWRENSNIRTLQIALHGVPASPTVDLKASSDLGASNEDNITSDNTPTITTVAFPQSTATSIVAARTGGGAVDVTASIATGDGEVDLGVLADGTWTITATQGTSVATLEITVDTTVPTISGVTSTSNTVTFTTSEAGVVAANAACGIAADRTVVSGENTIQLTGLTDGAAYNNCTFTVTDVAGNSSATTDIPDFTFQAFAVDLKASSDTGTSQTDDITNDNTPTIVTSGFTQGAATAIAATKTGSTTVTATIAAGNGEVDLGTLADGTWTITATQGSNSATLEITVDTRTPTMMITTLFYAGHLDRDTDLYINKADSEDASGTIFRILPGSSYVVTQVLTSAATTCDASAGTFGSSNIETDDVTSDGSYKVCLRLEDVAGNIGYVTSSVFTRDTVVPTISGITSTSNTVTFTTSEAGVVAANAACGIAADRTVVSGENTIQLTGLTDGAAYNNCTFTVTDVAGNSSATTDIPDFTFEAFSVDLKASSDTGSSQTDNNTNDNTPTIVTSGFTGGTATTISATKTGSTTVTATIAAGNGEVDLGTLADGRWTITATQGENSATLEIRIDTAIPVVSSSFKNGFSGALQHSTDLYINKADNDASPAKSIFARSAGLLSTAVIASSATCDGSVTFTSAQLKTTDVTVDGTYKVCLREQDLAGNSGYGASPTFTRDTVVPTISGVTSTSNTVTFTPSEAGVVATNVACGIPPSTTVSSGENIIYFIGLTDSTLYDSCTFTVTDAAGNPSAVTDIPDFTFETLAIDLKASSDTGVSDDDGLTGDVTPTFTLSGFGSGEVVVTASHTSETSVVARRNGNGDVTMGTLADGEWGVVAIQGPILATATVTIQADLPTLAVSNTGQARRSSGTPAGFLDPNIFTSANQFTTGSALYLLEQVQYHIHGVTPDGDDDFTISIQGVGSDGNPDGTKIGSVTVDHDDVESIGLKTATFVAPVALSPSTSYFVVFEYSSASGFVNISVTASNSEDSGSLVNWSMANTLLQSIDSVWISGSGSILFGLYGSEVTYAVYLKAASDTGSSQVDNITKTTTPIITVSGYESSASITVKAVKGGTTQTAPVRTGNGDVTLPTLTDGVWSVTATDGTNVSQTLSITIDTAAPTVTAKPFAGHLSSTDSYINKADHEGTSGALLGTVTGGGTLSYALVVSSATCDATQTYVATIPATADVTTDGTYKICIRVTDTAGNIAYDATSTFTRDVTVPVISSVSSTGNTVTFSSTEVGTVTANASCGISARAVVSGSNTIAITGLVGGQTYGSCTISMTDAAGNPAVAKSIPSFVFDALELDLKASSDTGLSDDDDLTGDTTPTIVVSGLDLNQSIVITADHGSLDDVVVTGNGDGTTDEYDLGELGDGEWSITATDGTDTTPALVITVQADLPVLMVSNTGQTRSAFTYVYGSGTNNAYIRANQFTTGSTPYLLKQLQYYVGAAVTDANEDFTISIQGVDDDGYPDGTKIGSVTVDHDDVESIGLKTATFATPVVLAASTSYLVVFEYSGPLLSAASLSVSSSVDEDAGTLDGWSLSNKFVLTNDNGLSWETSSTSYSLILGFYGSEITYAIDLKTSSDTGSSQTDNITNNNTPVITVSGYDDAASVTVTADHTTDSNVADVTGTITGNGDVTLPALTDGVWGVSATDGTNVSNALVVTVDTEPLDLSLTSVYYAGHLNRNTDLYINKADSEDTSETILFLLRGSGYTATQVLTPATTTCDASAGTFGSSDIETDDVASDGSYKVCVKIEDVAGNAQYLSSVTFTRDTVAPTISDVSSIGTTGDPTPDLTFTTSEAGVLVVNAGCGIRAEAVVAGSNTITLSTLAPNTYASCTISMTDAAGNPQATATAITSFTIEAVAVEIAALATTPATTRTATATVTGTSPSDLHWALFNPSASPAETCGSGLTFPPSNTYTSGVAVTISSSDTDNGKKACFRVTIGGVTKYVESDSIAGVDTTNPVAVLTFQTKRAGASAVAFTSSTADVFLKAQDQFIFTDASTDSGSGVDTKTLVAKIGTQSEHTLGTATNLTLVSGTQGGSSIWTATADSTTGSGIIKYTYSITDEATNPHSISSTFTNLYVDTVDPATPVIDLNTASDTGVSNTDNITNNTTPTFSITNDSARVKGTGGVAIDNDNGKSAEVIEWHLTSAGGSTFTKQSATANTFTPSTALTDGVYKVKAKFVDKAGNEAESAVITFTIDTSAPAKPDTPDLGSGSDTGYLDTDNITNDATPNIFATAVADHTYEWTVDGTVSSLSSTRTLAITANLSEGNRTFTVKTVDVAGNKSPASDALTVVVDKTAPPAPNVSRGLWDREDSGLSDSDNITNETQPTVDGRTIAGVNNYGGVKTHFVANSSANATCPVKAVSSDTLNTDLLRILGDSFNADAVHTVSGYPSSALSDGKYCVYVEQADLAGNRVVSSGFAVYIDTTAPSASGLTFDLLDAFDSTRQEVAADEEGDNDDVWTPGKTDDYTNKRSVSIQVANVPIETIMGTRRNGKIDISAFLSLTGPSSPTHTAEYTIANPSADTASHTFAGVRLSSSNSVATSTAYVVRAFVTDVAGNKLSVGKDFSLNLDYKTKTPETPDLDVGSDSGTSDTDNYTNAEYLDITVEDDDADSANTREYPTIVRLYSWTDTDADSAVDANELTVLQRETSPEDNTANLVAVDWLIKGSSSGQDVTFENIVLAEGTHKIVAGQIDKAGNAQAYSAPLTIYVDRTAPTAPAAATLNSADDSGAERPGAQTAEINAYRVDGITNVASDLSFFGCADPSDVRTVDPTDVAIVTAVVRDDASAVVTDTGTANTVNSGRSVSFGDALVDSGGDPVRPTTCPDGLYPYTLDLDETYGAANRSETYTVSMTATDLAGNISEEGAAATIIIDQLKPSESLGDVDLDDVTDNGDSTTDNATSLTDLLYVTNKHSIDNNGAQIYQGRAHKSLSHYEIGLQLYVNGATSGEIFTAPATEHVTYFQGATIPAQSINGDQTLPQRTLTGEGIALLVKGLALNFDQYSNTYQTRVRAVDVAGNVRELSPTSTVTYLLPPPPITSADLQTASDSTSGVTGTTTDNITNATSWVIDGSFTYRATNNNPAINIVRARVVNTANNVAVATANITAINHGSITGCADESDTCSETNDTDSTFTHTFDLSGINLADGDYRIELQTYNGSEAGATNGGDTALVVTYDSTPPSNETLLGHLTVGAKFIDGTLKGIAIAHDGAKPLNGAFKVYQGETPTLIHTETPLTNDFVVNLATEAHLDPTFSYSFSYTDAAGNESGRVALPQMPDIRIVRLGDTTPARYAATGISKEGAVGFGTIVDDAIAFGFYQTTGTGSSVTCGDRSSNAYAAYASGDAQSLTGQNLRICFYKGHVLGNAKLYVTKDTQGSPDFASITLNVDDDTTISSITRSNNAFTQATRPRIDGSSLPETPVRIYRVTEAQFDGATSGSEWSELAVDANKVFDNTTADDGTFTIPAPSTALAEGVYRLAASISLDDGSTYTAVAQVFTLTIDTTAPDKQPNTPVIKTGTDDTGSSQTDGITSTESIVITHATALATGEEQFTCYLNGAQVSTHYQSRDCTIALPQDGTHTITTTITDNAGNESPHSDPLTLTLDSTDPDITIIRLFDTDTTIDTNTRFIAVAADQTTVVFKVVEETKAACSARTSDASTAYAAGTQFDPTDTSTDGYCFVATDTAGNRATFHTDDAIEGVGSFAIQGGTTEASTVYTTSGTKTITGISAPEAKVLIKLADATDDPTTYTTTDLQSTSFATTSFDIPTGETSFSESLSISTSDNGKKVIGWIWTDAADQTTATPAITLTTLTVDNTAPTITAGTITSDNSDPTFAKQGDTITATFTVSEALQTQTTTINTVAATCSASSNTYTCTATLTNDATEGAAVVTTTAVDKAGNRTTKTTTDSTITVDATAPTLTITALPREHFKANDRLSFTLTLTDTNQIRQGTYTFTATGATLQTCTITVPATSNTESTTCTFTTTNATDGTPVALTIPTLTDTPGNSRASYTTTLGYVDTTAPTIDEIISQDAKTKKFTFSLAVTHNQHASNTNSETLTPVFSGDCEDRITADPTWTGTTTGTYKTTATAKAGTYKTCTIALTDEAGNTSLTQTFDEFKVKGSGGVASIGGAVSRMISSVSGVFSGGNEQSQEQSQQDITPTAPTLFEVVQESTPQQEQEIQISTTDLTLGSVGEEVRTLQKLLNSLGFTVATTGPGSPGEETTYFGPATQRALIRYQEANGITPALGYYGPLTRERMQQQLAQRRQQQEQSQPSSLLSLEGQQPVNQSEDTPLFEETPTEDIVTFVTEAGDLTLGSVGEEVRLLQRLLNSLGFTVATTGPGSPGEETTYFGPATQRALIRYQQANGITPALGYFGPLTREHILQSQQSQQRPVQTEAVGSFTEGTGQEGQSEPVPIEEVRSFTETVEQEEDATNYDPITDSLFRVRGPSSAGAPTFFSPSQQQPTVPVEEVRSFTETVEQEEEQPLQQEQGSVDEQEEGSVDYEPITTPLFRVRGPSSAGAPQF